MRMWQTLLLASTLIGAFSSARAECIPAADLKKEEPNTQSYVHEVRRSGGRVVSIYRKGNSFEDFIEVIREGRCIISTEPLTADQLVSRYLEYPEPWIVEQEAEDNEGMSEEEASAPVELDIRLSFFMPERFAVQKIYRGPMGRPDFRGRDKKFADFRELISESMKKGANFAGEYVVTEIGCGTSCSIAILSNLKTGKQFYFPTGGEEAGPLSLKYSANSSLMIATWRDGDKCVLESLLFDGKIWTSLANSPIGIADACYEDVDQNIELYRRKILKGPDVSADDGSAKPTAGETAPLEPPTATQPERPEGLTEYDNVNVAALVDLYEGYEGVLACYQAREKQSSSYLTRSDMEKADAALKRDEAEILSRDPRIDKEAVRRRARDSSKLFTSVVLSYGKIQMNYEHREACRKLVALFPPGIVNARLRKREVIGEPNTGGGLIKPQDPRFR